ncbi:MAG: 4-hydroxy-tetrahydrodipicolinate synthase [Clostridia bacterium]|nr:4-hydroxy-tetrahydrodipicolinate synthase [Clostridia bacterium]MBR3576712.1 4-hydroxy-tetrahydrodipicolinate synthase [Clostridia bacterium]
MKKAPFTGSAVAIVTPLNENGIDYEAYDRLIEFQIANSTDAIVVAGTTGEASTLTDDEHVEIIRYTVEKVAGRVPVIAGTGSNDTAYAIELSKAAEKAGADALLLVTPYYNKTSQRGLYQHFKLNAEAVNIPVILYNVPGRTGMNISVDTCKKLSEVENIVAIKEASGDIGLAAKIAAACGDNLYLYSGNDDMITPMLSLGGKGVISVLANVCPKETHDICASYFEGDVKKSAALQLEYLDLVDALFCEVNPIPVKTALNMMGFEVGELRLPLYEMADNNKETLRKALVNHGCIK